jgi:putative RNA 2'-phosphotransferase
MGMGWDFETLSEVVATDDKGRYEFSDDGSRIRALHGHSVDVDLGYADELPPDVLFHGTSEASLDSIMRKGILPMSRLFVHLSDRPDEAETVGSRHGTPVVLVVDARGMVEEGRVFHLSADGVWLTNEVPVRFLHLAERNW